MSVQCKIGYFFKIPQIPLAFRMSFLEEATQIIQATCKGETFPEEIGSHLFHKL